MSWAAKNDGAALPWVMAICGYFAFQAGWRWWLGAGLGLDEAQILLDARALAWGYGPQPPLYAWLQWAVFQIVDDPILGMSVLKNALLATTYLAVFALFRSVYPAHVAGLAALSLMLLPQIAWESQRALTHSVLATSLGALICLVFWTRLLPGLRGGYALFGLLAGLGFIAKVNFAVVPIALVLAAFSMSEHRAKLRIRGLAGSLVISGIVVAGPVLWMWRNRERAFASVGKMDLAGADAVWLRGALEGLAAVALASLLFVALPVFVAVVIRWVAARSERILKAAPLERFLWRVVAISVLITIVVVIGAGATNVKDRWMQPALFMAAPLIAVWLLRRVTPGGAKALAGVVAALAVLVIAALPFHMLLGTGGAPPRMSAPVGAIAESVAMAHPETPGIVADREWLAGNLAWQLPDRRVERLALAGADMIGPEGVFLVWMDGGPEEGTALAALLSMKWGVRLQAGPVEAFAAPYPYAPDERFRVHAMVLRPEP